jgi:phosphomevalonate kinase
MEGSCIDRWKAKKQIVLILVRLYSHSTASRSKNIFVETALAYALTYVSALGHANIRPASITILADTDYYSRPGLASTEIPADRRFLDFNVPLSLAHKTGLGSSAALVTAFTAAILSHSLPPDLLQLESENGKACLHGLAQAAHCAAQGKVGSGFDVAAAVYGSCVYRRFSPSILKDLGEVGTNGFATRLKSLIGDGDQPSIWDMEIDKSRAFIPSGLRLIMCDVDCGSETVGMAKRVLAWRDGHVEVAAILWGNLQKANDDLAEELRSLAQKPTRTSIDYEHLRNHFAVIRTLIREMSTKAEVPIEPKAQTDLLDTCCRVLGVVGGVVPGAGGYDAILLLIEDREEVMAALKRVLDTYKPKEGYGNEPRIGQVRLLGVRQDIEGLKVENPNIYSGWTR